jgi:Sec-independent protein translocase protein TatA
MKAIWNFLKDTWEIILVIIVLIVVFNLNHILK